VAVLRGELSTSGTELFTPILEKVAEISGVTYEFDADEGVRMRRIADHVRAAVFCLSDGVKPGREGREFVLRRVIRRAVRDGISLGIDRPFVADLAPVVAEIMAGPYPELTDHLEEITLHLTREEERFRATYFQGLNELTHAVDRLVEEGGSVLPGSVAFRLHDERGFPVDVTEDYLREEGLSLDREGFEREMEARKIQSQEGSKLEGDIFARGPLAELKSHHGVTEFTGYETCEDEAGLIGLASGGEAVPEGSEGDEVSVVADRTPFYAEAGGQIGDAGEIVGPCGKVAIRDTRSAEGVYAMIGRVSEGTVRAGERVRLVVDGARRDAIRRNHTATHLLHKSLKNRLGEGATQAGSLVAPDRLRFDFHFTRGLTPEEIGDVEREVNREIWRNTGLSTAVQDAREARAAGAMALFGEKDGERVRVVSVGEYSNELCGGTHCAATGEIGSFRIVSESAVGAGLRRIEAVTGQGAVMLMDRDRSLLRDLGRELKVPVEELPARVSFLREEIRRLERKVDEALTAGGGAPGPEESTEVLENGVELRLLSYAGPYEMKHLLAGADRVRAEDGRVVALLSAQAGEGLSLVVAATRDVVDAGFDAGSVVGRVAKALGGGGGGRPDLGQGKGRDAAALPEGVAVLRGAVEEVGP
jgi:alanyl-tRNA synthetase